GATTEGRRDSSFEERLLLTGTAWEMFVENAAVGVGAGNYTARFSEYAQRFGSAAHDYHDPAAPRYPHNLLLEVGAETGAVGLSVFAGALLAAFLALGRVGGRDSPPEAHALRGLARAFQIALAGYLVSSLFLHGDFQRYLWLLLGMAGALDAMVAPARSSRRRLETQDATAPDGAAPDHTPVARHGAGGPPTARRGIAVLLSRFPSVTETFILREVIEMERQGQPVLLVPLLRESPPVVHREAVPWVRRALYTPFVSPAILAANLRAVLRHPIRYVTVVARVVVGTLRSPRIALGTLGIIPKSIYLAERIRAEGIRHVHAHFATHPTTAALIISALTGASFSFTIHAHDLFSRRYRPLLPLKLRRAAFVRVISRYNRDHLQRLYPDVPLEKVHVVHVGIEPELYAGDADREPTVLAVPSPAAAPPPVRLLSVAALRDYKGLPVLLEACRRLRRDGVAVQCDVVGEGPMRPQLERMIRELELESCARLLGAKPQDEVRRLLAEQPIFVLSSVVLRDGWMEGIPVALMEAMASGCAVISSRLSGIPELVESGVTGMLVEPGDAGALADAIRAVASDPGRARRLGAGGRARVDAAFRLDRTVTELLSLVDAHNGFEAPPVLQAAVGQIRPAADAAPVGIRRVHHGSDALALELMVPTTTGAPSEVVLKVHREHARASRPAAERAHNEWTALKMFQSGWRPLWNAVGVTAPRLGVPLPVHCAIDEGWLVMETCTGRNLSHVVRSARAGRDAREWSATVSALRAAGQWLRGFQRQPGTGQDPDVALMAWDAAVEADIRRCSSVVPDHLWRSARDRLGELTIAVAPHLSHGVLQHGDFGPGNVFVEEGRVQVIDFEGVRPGLPYEDVAYFVVQLELFFAWPLLGGRRLEAVSAFLAGYLDGDALNESAYRMARIAKALQVLGRPRRAGPLDYAGHRRHRALRRMLADAAA
ncbi:MAG TPA: glycosyltransferase, partial [Gemmatimonadaceae bacterium]|nr:glycosyltransferase [Gemmatimonadaceae bacterium]